MSKTIDRSKGANDNLSRQHWIEEIRNAMYQLSDDELLAFLSGHPMETERLRVCIRVIDG